MPPNKDDISLWLDQLKDDDKSVSNQALVNLLKVFNESFPSISKGIKHEWGDVQHLYFPMKRPMTVEEISIVEAAISASIREQYPRATSIVRQDEEDGDGNTVLHFVIRKSDWGASPLTSQSPYMPMYSTWYDNKTNGRKKP